MASFYIRSLSSAETASLMAVMEGVWKWVSAKVRGSTMKEVYSSKQSWFIFLRRRKYLLTLWAKFICLQYSLRSFSSTMYFSHTPLLRTKRTISSPPPNTSRSFSPRCVNQKLYFSMFLLASAGFFSKVSRKLMNPEAFRYGYSLSIISFRVQTVYTTSSRLYNSLSYYFPPISISVSRLDPLSYTPSGTELASIGFKAEGFLVKVSFCILSRLTISLTFSRSKVLEFFFSNLSMRTMLSLLVAKQDQSLVLEVSVLIWLSLNSFLNSLMRMRLMSLNSRLCLSAFTFFELLLSLETTERESLTVCYDFSMMTSSISSFWRISIDLLRLTLFILLTPFSLQLLSLGWFSFLEGPPSIFSSFFIFLPCFPTFFKFLGVLFPFRISQSGVDTAIFLEDSLILVGSTATWTCLVMQRLGSLASEWELVLPNRLELLCIKDSFFMKRQFFFLASVASLILGTYYRSVCMQQFFFSAVGMVISLDIFFSTDSLSLNLLGFSLSILRASRSKVRYLSAFSLPSSLSNFLIYNKITQSTSPSPEAHVSVFRSWPCWRRPTEKLASLTLEALCTFTRPSSCLHESQPVPYPCWRGRP